MSQRLTDMQISRVSLVDRGANEKRIAVLKRDEEASMNDQVAAALARVEGDERAGVAGWLRKAADALMGVPARAAPVAKVATFGEIVAGRALTQALDEAWYTLQDALWAAIWATDESGQALSLDAKTALVARNLDEFKAYLLAEMERGIEKRAGGDAARAQAALGVLVAKVGRKITASRLGRLNAAATALNSVLAEVADAEAEAETAEEDLVEKAEFEAVVKAAVSEAMAPLMARVEAIEKAGAPAADEGDEVTLGTLAEVVGKLADRIEAVEKARGTRASLAGQDGGEGVRKSTFAGILG